MKIIPQKFEIHPPDFVPSHYNNHIRRKLSDMNGQYQDQDAYEALLSQEDILLYQVYELERPKIKGELLHGISIVHPGKVGNEYFMTKGHFHNVLETGEIYYVLKGQGYMVMETPESETSVEKMQAGTVLYVPPRWAHRSVNISSDQDLVMLFVYPGNAGHNYGTIESQGFRKVVLELDGQAEIQDNPKAKLKEND